MAGIDRIQKRFDELVAMAEEIEKTSRPAFDGPQVVDLRQFTEWRNSALYLLHQVFGETSPTVKNFESADSSWDASSLSYFIELWAIFRSAKEQFEGGHLFDVRNLVHASIFADELSQAEHLLKEQYKVPAAVIAGVALETTLRKLYDQHPDLEPAKADTMISDLAKKSIFNKMRADQLRAWMKIRNSAAHGKPDEFNDNDVTRMIDGVRDFIANHMR